MKTFLSSVRNALRLYWLPLAAAALLMVFLAAAGSVVWKNYRTALIDSQTRQMELMVQSLSDSISFSLNEYNDRLEAAARRLEADDNAHPTLARSDTIVDLWIENTDGKVIYSVYGLTPISDLLITQTDTISYWQYHAGDQHYMVLKKAVGSQSVCLVIDSEALYRQLISDIRVGENGYVMVKNADNVVLMHPEEAQWGINVIDGRLDLYRSDNLDLSDLTDLVTTQQAETSGISDYYSYWWTDPGLPRVHKISAYRQLPIGDSFWIVSAVVDYDDLYRPVADSFRQVATLFTVLGIVMVAFTAAVLRMQHRARLAERENENLKTLNAALEELHRSEESLAHNQRLQLMGTMTGGIAHEFNNFLTPITGYADLIMADADPDSEVYDNAREISEAAEKAKDVVRQISSMSRKNVETVYDTVPVVRLIERTRGLVATNCPKNITLSTDVRLETTCMLGNSTQLQQVLLNICVNAIHAIGADEGSLTIWADCVPRAELTARLPDEKISDEWPVYVRIGVTDTGCGMDKDILAKIFEPFFTTKKAGEGTGLGLALADQIIRTHRGRICADSTPGKGTTFTLYLPVYEPQQAREQLQWGVDHRLRLLAADDNQKVLDMLRKDFGRLGLSVTTCAVRDDVRDLLAKEHFDVLAVNESITGSTGIDFCMSIQNQYPGLTRLVMVSTPTREVVDARSHRVIDGYVLKPVSASALLAEARAARRKG